MDNEAVGIPAVGTLFPKPPRAQSKTLAWLMPTTILIFRQQIRYLETLINVSDIFEFDGHLDYGCRGRIFRLKKIGIELGEHGAGLGKLFGQCRRGYSPSVPECLKQGALWQ